MGKKARLKAVRRHGDAGAVSAARTPEITPSAESILPVMIVAAIVLILKLVISYHAYGTNDIKYWMEFARTIQESGTFKIYSLIRIYNHPPLISWVLKAVSGLSAATGLAFPFVFRLMPICADLAGIVIIWKLLGLYGSRHRVLLASICAINPVNFFVSGFHGNTDPVFVTLLLAAIYCIEKGRPAASGAWYGLSLCIKIVPVLLLPAFLFYIRKMRDRLFFLLSAAVAPAVVFLPYLVKEYHAVITNIFLYSSLKGIWGIGHICLSIVRDPAAGAEVRRLFMRILTMHIAYGQIVFLVVLVALLAVLTRRRALNMTEGAFLSFCAFLALTPGFGVQYLSWLSVFAVMALPVLGTVYVVLGGIFLFRVYRYWSGGVPPYFADSDTVGQWIGFEKTLDLAVWGVVVVMLAAFIFMKLVRPRQALQE